MTTEATTTDVTRVLDLIDQLVRAHDPNGDRHEFMRAQFDMGLAWVHFPEGRGGLGLAPNLQNVIDERLDQLTPHRPRVFDILGHGMGAPMLVAHGSEAQLDRYLRPMFTGEEVWCQLFSEPNAGSDVAGLATRAIQDGEEWIVNGQKVWTTAAQLAKWGMVVTRTDPDLPKHKGMTYFLMDMEAEGVEVRPIRQITGEGEFNEVYMTDVRIPDSNRIGGRGDGWRVALTTLMNERVAIGARVAPRNSGAIADLLEVWDSTGRPADRRDEVMRLWVAAEAARLTNQRAAENRKAGTPGPEGSTAKLVFAELNKKIYELATDLMGPEGMLYDSYSFTVPDPNEEASTDVRRRFLRARANSIEGGTSEIMKNILGEQVLRLPGEPRVDKDVAWSDIPRS
ncbi:MAG: acyl-CoA dehydrogenase family protein [Acidimicrobiia bacterium]|nr:acyl-CoA dehydrogenase family protein [Acidimicrobiia bacterium]